MQNADQGNQDLRFVIAVPSVKSWVWHLHEVYLNGRVCRKGALNNAPILAYSFGSCNQRGSQL
jgi:hypothetical protein